MATRSCPGRLWSTGRRTDAPGAPLTPRRVALAAVCMALLFAAPVDASPRAWQPLILKGARLGPLLGAHEDNLEVLAMQSGALVPIPFEVDERLPDGRYALPNGPEPLADDSPGILDRDDELVMMLADLGQRAQPPAALPPHTEEVEVVDPLGGPNRYAYVAVVAAPMRSPRIYVDYDSMFDRVETDNYKMRFTAGWPTDFALQKQMHQGARNLIDRFKVRTRAKVLRIFHFHMNEDDIHNRLVAWRVGPIRVIRRTEHSVSLLFGIRSPQVNSLTIFYRNYVESPTKVDFPWLPRLIFSDVAVRADIDYIGLKGFLFSWSSMHGEPVVTLSGSKRERWLMNASPPPKARWIALEGQGHLMVQTFKPSFDLNLIDQRVYYVDSSKPDPPETCPGQHPGVGYITTGWTNLSGGTHVLDSLFVVVHDNYRPREVIDELRVRPRVSVRPAPAPAAKQAE
jgi:hypothetical protein